MLRANLDNMGTSVFGHCPDVADDTLVNAFAETDDLTGGQRGYRRLEMKHASEWHGCNRPLIAQRFGKALDTCFVSAIGKTDVHRVANLEDVAAVESASSEVFDRQAKPVEKLGNPFGFRSSAHGTRTAHHSGVTEDDHRVFNENRVRTIIGWSAFDDVPASA